MIRLLQTADIPAVFSRQGDWQLFRIQALLRAYGTDYDFCRFYRQEESGGLLSVLDQGGILSVSEDAELMEWWDYLSVAGLRSLTVTDRAGAFFSKMGCTLSATGAIFRYGNEAEASGQPIPKASGMTELKAVYGILCDSFEMGAFEPWYCDISRRLRTETAIQYWLKGEGCAFVTADTDRLFLSAVAVSPNQRGQGVGSRMLEGILSEHRGKQAAVYSRNPNADRFYKRLGFEEIGRWFEYQIG